MRTYIGVCTCHVIVFRGYGYLIEAQMGEDQVAATCSQRRRAMDTFEGLGLKLEVLQAGDSSTRRGGQVWPTVGQTVTLSYTGRLNDSAGAVFDSNVGKEPLTVRVGRGQVISGWDAALPYISCGQHVRLTVPAALAYGSKGKPGRIPPNATLSFDIELCSIVPDSPAEALLEAASQGETVAALRALRNGAAVDHADRKGLTALHLAAQGGHTELVMQLLEAGAKADAVNGAGVTPLMYAVNASCEPLCARLLIRARADATLKSQKGTSALALMQSDRAYTTIRSECSAVEAGAEPIARAPWL